MGQITLESAFGKTLRELARRPDMVGWVEVGAWDGRGSTACIAAGLVGRGDGATLTSLEADHARAAEAQAVWRGNNYVRVLHGRLGKCMMSREDVASHPLASRVPQWPAWYDGEAKAFASAPIVDRDALPPSVDAVVLDGGEFSTAGDWDVLAPLGPKVVALDDVAAIKCADIAAALRANVAWIEVASGVDRGGWAVFERRC